MMRRRLAWLVQWIVDRWRALSHWFAANSLAPEWLPASWRQPLVGYLFAVGLILLAIALELAAAQALPHVDAVSGVFVFLVILFVGLQWGAGPSLLATVLGTVLLYYLIYPPLFAITRADLTDILQGGLVLFGGLFVTQAASQRERQRRAAEMRASEQAQADALAHRAAMRQMEAFVERAGHELKTPLASLQLGLQAAQHRLDRLIHQAETGQAEDKEPQLLQRVQQYLEPLPQSLTRLERLVRDLLDSTHLAAGSLELHRERADLRAIVAAAVEEQQARTPDRTICLQALPEQPVLVRADVQRIGQVVSHYLSNALKYSAEARPVEVGVAVGGQQGRVWVRDGGPGVPAGQQNSLWERFYRAPEIAVESGSGVGLGLGLYISRGLIEQHGGEVGVQSTPGLGSSFWFTLPLEQAAES
jgi:signal transduction histidine kinase